MSATRLLLIDDHAMFRNGLAALLRMSIASADVSEAASIDEALHGPDTHPDVVLLDIMLKGLNGLVGMDLIKRRWPQAAVVMVSSEATPATIQLALDKGATAFVSKEKSADSILNVVRKLTGHTPQSTGMAPATTQATEHTGTTPLTPRQFEVLDLLCQGLTNKAIGRKLDLSENTVRWHVQAILGMLKVNSRSEAVFAARSQGLVG
jgi:DNA-binding NarL/FixJ family response regulator